MIIVIIIIYGHHRYLWFPWLSGIIYGSHQWVLLYLSSLSISGYHGYLWIFMVIISGCHG